MGFDSLPLPTDGSPVTAESVNRPLRRADDNARYLLDRINAAGVGSSVTLFSRTVSPECVVGTPVYFSDAAARFEPALASVDADAAGVVSLAAQAVVWGVVLRKRSADLGDVLVCGDAALDVSAAAGSPVTPGLYYLSAATPGRLTREKPPVAVPVLRAYGGRVFVWPHSIDFGDRHSHRRIPLACVPAGDTSPPAEGGRHEITDPDDSLAGWLPADHESFDGTAPAGAVFGYNVAGDPALAAAWPPSPVSGCHLEWDRGEGGSGVPVGPSGLCVIDRNGIWWLSDCAGDAPWPADLDTTTTASSSSGSSGGDCPRPRAMRMTLWFTAVSFLTDATAVLSLRSVSPRLSVTCRGTDTPATAGDLDVRLDLDLTVGSGDETGYKAFKSFDPATGSFRLGNVVEGLYAGGQNVSLSGQATTVRRVEGEDKTVHHGLVAVSVAPASSLRLDAQLVRLDGAEDEMYLGLPYLGFAAGVERSYRARVDVPVGTGLASPVVSLEFYVLGRAAGTLPQLTVTARRLARPSGSPASLPLEAAEFAVDVDTTAVLSSSNQYVLAASEPFEVAEGDSVFFSVTRADDDGYPAEVGVLRQTGVLYSG